MKNPVFPDVAIVGMHFREKEGIPAKEITASFEQGQHVELEREPKNKFDEYAIKAIFNGMHIGYLEASQAMWIAPNMDEGLKMVAVVDRLEQRKNNLHPICTIQVDERDPA